METFRSAGSKSSKGIDIDPAGTGGWEGFSTDAGHPSRPEGAVEEAEAAGTRKTGADREERISVNSGPGASNASDAADGSGTDSRGDDAASASGTGIGSAASTSDDTPVSKMANTDANSSAGAGAGASGAGDTPESRGGGGVPSGSGAAPLPATGGNEPSSGKGESGGGIPPTLQNIAPTEANSVNPPPIDSDLGQDKSGEKGAGS